MSATIAETPEMLTTVDGKPLKQAMQTAQRRARIRAFLLVFPLLAFVVVTFIFPILQMLHNSMHNPGFIIHRDIETKVETPIMINLQQWFKDNPAGTPVGEDAYAALVEDLRFLKEMRAAGQVGTRLNYELSGTRSMFTKAARKAPS